MINEIEVRWIPGLGPDQSALDSLRSHFGTRPATPPGEAWFMSKERRFFTEFVDQSMNTVPAAIIQDFLSDISIGFSSFSEAEEEVQDWISWYKYMLFYLVERGHESCVGFLVEIAITAFIRIFGDDLNDEYLGFREDALRTLGQVLMKPEFWNAQGECNAALKQNWLNGNRELLEEISCSGAISASLFFCLLYLPTESVALWTSSVLEIKSVHFKAHFLVWLASISKLIVHSTSIGLGSIEELPYRIEWDNSFVLQKTDPKISHESMNQLLSTIRAGLSKEILSKWSAQISEIEELREMMERFLIFPQVSDFFLAQ